MKFKILSKYGIKRTDSCRVALMLLDHLTPKYPGDFVALYKDAKLVCERSIPRE